MNKNLIVYWPFNCLYLDSIVKPLKATNRTFGDTRAFALLLQDEYTSISQGLSQKNHIKRQDSCKRMQNRTICTVRILELSVLVCFFISNKNMRLNGLIAALILHFTVVLFLPEQLKASLQAQFLKIEILMSYLVCN